MFAVLVLTCFLSYATAVPAFAGGLSKPVVPSMFAGANAGAPSNFASNTPTDPDCPATDGTIPLYIPDPESCTKYTVCSGEFGQKLECAPGMHFNAATSSCTFPALANCPLLAKVTETVSMTDLKGAPGIDPTAYPNMGLTGMPKFGNPAEGIGQLPNSAVKESQSGGEEALDATESSVEATTSESIWAKVKRNMLAKLTI